MKIKIITAPVLEPVTLAEAKAQCRVDVADDDALIERLIVAAREWCQAHDWRAYLTQTIELWLEAWPANGIIELPRPPLQSVTSIEYYDTSDVKITTFDSTNYFVDMVDEPGHVALRYLKSWPTTMLRSMNPICVTYKAGWTTAALVPQTIKQAMLLLIGHWYENREEAITGTISRSIEFGVKALLGVERAFRF